MVRRYCSKDGIVEVQFEHHFCPACGGALVDNQEGDLSLTIPVTFNDIEFWKQFHASRLTTADVNAVCRYATSNLDILLNRGVVTFKGFNNQKVLISCGGEYPQGTLILQTKKEGELT